MVPFAVATPVAPAAEPQASFAANWFVSGIARIGDQDFVTIKHAIFPRNSHSRK